MDNKRRRCSRAVAGGSSFPADLLVCADSVGSSSRASLLPSAAAICWLCRVAWHGAGVRGSPPELTVRLTQAITYYVYANSHILSFSIPALDGSVEQGRRLINFVWYRNYLDGSDLDDLLTDSVGERRDISVPPGVSTLIRTKRVLLPAHDCRAIWLP